MEQFAHKLMGVSLDAVADLNIKDLGITLGIVVDKLMALKASAKADAQQPVQEQKKEKSVLDVSKLYPHEQNNFFKYLDKMSGRTDVIYPPQPGDPDYDPGLPPERPEIENAVAE